jgi:hypothetical protein
MQQVIDWRAQQAHECEQDWDWIGALFHLDRWLELQPQDESLRHRRAYAQLAWDHAHTGNVSYAAARAIMPPRDPWAPAQTVDLTPYYNSSKRSGSDGLWTLPSGLQTFGGTVFDVRGTVQLSSRQERARATRYPERVDRIRVGRRCGKLSFLQATFYAAPSGTPVGEYIVRYDDGGTATIPLVYGQDTRDWWTQPNEPFTARRAALVWLGANPRGGASGHLLRLFKSSWPNPRPEAIVTTVDFVSSMNDPGPFLAALTAE